MSNDATGVVGTDGKVPSFDANGLWRMWAIGEIFTGQTGENKYVPKKNDYVIDPSTFTTYIVDDLDPITLIPTLREIRPANMSFSFSDTDVLFGVGPGTQSDTYRVYLDTSVTPHVLAVDVRLRVAGSMASYAKIFKGSVLNETEGHVISKTYDSSGNFVSQNVGLELVAVDSHENHSVKIVRVCHCTEQLQDGEIVTVVVYSDNGHVVSKRQLLVENTAFIRGLNTSLKYVTHISLESPFLSQSVDKTIEYPLNVPTNALNLMGNVHYSNGEVLRLPVDGTKFRMFGLQQFVSTIVGQKMDLVLSYALSSNETAYAGVSGDGNFVTEGYELLVVNPNNSYTVKLFGYPYWVDSAVGYQMRWFLMNLDRNLFFDVTDKVAFAQNTGPFDPKGYGYMQRKAVTLNLRDVSGTFKAFVHTQTVEIVLNGEPQSDSTAWLMSHESNSSRPSYGLDIFAKRKSANTLNLSSDIATFAEWKTRVYEHTFPLINPNTDVVPLTPTHILVTLNNVTNEYPITDWATDLVMSGTVTAKQTVGIRFIKRTASGDLQLAMAAMIVRP